MGYRPTTPHVTGNRLHHQKYGGAPRNGNDGGAHAGGAAGERTKHIELVTRKHCVDCQNLILHVIHNINRGVHRRHCGRERKTSTTILDVARYSRGA